MSGDALGILSQLGKSSTAKYEAMQHWLCPDGRAHGGLLYHAASTGRWGGQGVQPQNFPRGTIDDFDMDDAWTFLKTRDVEFLQVIYGSVMAALSQALRGAIIAAPGKRLYVADYASIEARVLLWLAEDDDALEVFRQNQDIYCDMASSIYGRPVTKKDKDERQMGKQAILGLGYQMGWSKFVATCETVGIHIEDEFSQQVVSAYREKYWRVKNLWEEQESRAIQAVRYGQDYEIPTGRVAWSMDGRFLYCTLPSGRRLAYCDPEIRRAFTPWGDRRDQLTFMAPDPITKQWRRQHTYGGMLVENITQAVARDLMADALLRCEQSGVFQPVLTVHDELIAEGDPGLDIHAFERLMTEGSDWAAGCPIKAEGFVCDRYHK
jgi:DNA polymerase